EERAPADQPLERDGWTAVAGGGARLVLRDRDRGELAIVVALEIDELAVRIDDRDAHAAPVALLQLGDRGGGDLLGGLDVDRRAVGQRLHLGRHVLVRIGRIGRRYLRQGAAAE